MIIKQTCMREIANNKNLSLRNLSFSIPDIFKYFTKSSYKSSFENIAVPKSKT